MTATYRAVKTVIYKSSKFIASLDKILMYKKKVKSNLRIKVNRWLILISQIVSMVVIKLKKG
jgi:hypothetical protein